MGGRRLGRFVLGLAALTLTACVDGGRGHRLVVHSSLPRDLNRFVEGVFETDHDSVDVRVLSRTPEETLAALRTGHEPVDVWWGAPGETLALAAREGLLQPFVPSWAAPSPDVGVADAEGRWQVSLVSPFVIAFNRDSVELARAPREWTVLFHFRWVDRVAVPDPTTNSESATFAGAMIVEALRDDDDLLRGFDWLRRLDGVVDQYAVDVAEAIRWLRTGRAAMAILPRHEVEAARHDDAPWVHYRLAESGVPVMSRGIGLAAASTEPGLARRFVDVTATGAVATEAKLRTRWTPVHGEIDASRLPSDFELSASWVAFPLAADTLAFELPGWIARWSAEVRDKGQI